MDELLVLELLLLLLSNFSAFISFLKNPLRRVFCYNSNMNKIKILATGGTFEKCYNTRTGELDFHESHWEEILKLGRCQLDTSLRTLMMIDSLDMTENDRELIANYCEKSEEQHIIITHGTDTMVETAKFIDAKKLKKTVIITGAMVPYSFGKSDALFNMGTAVAYSQSMPHGVYIAMNGKCFPWNNVRKNRELGVFEELK